MSMHIGAKAGEISKTVIVAGDPNRIEYIAKTYLDSPICVSDKRGALCYTGKYQGLPLSLLATGMGVPSMLIYATELYRDYDCAAIIRIGTAAGYVPGMQRHEVVLSQAACHTSGINDDLFSGTFCPIADFGLLVHAAAVARERKIKVYIGNTVCNDRLYRPVVNHKSAMWAKYGVLCSEMEGAGLYTAAAQFGKKALMLVSVLSQIALDSSGQEMITSLPEEPGRSIDDAILLALDTAVNFEKGGDHGRI